MPSQLFVIQSSSFSHLPFLYTRLPLVCNFLLFLCQLPFPPPDFLHFPFSSPFLLHSSPFFSYSHPFSSCLFSYTTQSRQIVAKTSEVSYTHPAIIAKLFQDGSDLIDLFMSASQPKAKKPERRLLGVNISQDSWIITRGTHPSKFINCFPNSLHYHRCQQDHSYHWRWAPWKT